MGGKVVRLMRGLIASGILLSLAVLAIGFAGGFAPLWENMYPWQCTRLCDDDFWENATSDEVRIELLAGADVNRIRASDGNSPLHLAVQGPTSPAIVEMLLNARADVNRTRATDRNTPLHLAVRGPTSPEIVELLLSAGADPNVSAFRDLGRDPHRRQLSPRTPLQMATEYGEHTPDVIRLLLEYGADPNPPIDPDTWRRSLSPLNYSLLGNRRHKSEIVEILLQYGADPNARARGYEQEGSTVLHIAAGVADIQMLEMFLSYEADFHARSKPEGYYSGLAEGTVLHVAARKNPSSESIEFLIDLGIDVDVRTRREITPLHLASLHNANPDVVQVLLENGADPNARSIVGGTPLLWAIAGYYCEDALHCQQVVGLLLDSGSDANGRDDWGDTPLHESIIYKRDVKVIQKLLDHGADVTVEHNRWAGGNFRPSSPLTPLHLAAYVGSPTEVIELLIERGADVKARDENGLTPLHLAAGNNGNSHIVQYLLSRGADSNARDANGETPLHLAAKGDLCRRHEAHCRFLVSHLLYNSADTNALNNEGDSPLHFAISSALDRSLIRMLLEFGADPALMNSEGATALHMALALPRYRRDEHANTLGIVNALLDSGMDVNIRSGPATGSQQEGLGLATPLHWVMYYSRSNDEVAKDLVRRGADLQATNQLSETPCQLAIRFIKMGSSYQQVCT